MLNVVLIRPGSTDFDTQGRITGTLDVPLNEQGAAQVERTVDELGRWRLDAVYCSPCQACKQTAQVLAAAHHVKVRQLDGLKNLDHGLWHGKRVQEVKQTQPKVYRQWQEHPERVCPPEGESLQSVQSRLKAAIAKLVKKHKDGAIAIVTPEPLASVVRSLLSDSKLGDLWRSECRCGFWEVIEVPRSERLDSGTVSA